MLGLCWFNFFIFPFLFFIFYISCYKALLQVFIVHEFNEITSDKLFLTEKIDKLKLHKVYICFCSFEGTVLGKNPIAVSISRIGGLATMNII